MTVPIRFAAGRYTGGQPTPAQLAELPGHGVRTVINLRTPDEPVEYDEAAEAARLGLRYLTFPICGAADLAPERVRQFGAALEEAARVGGVLVHCASSNRVGAMIALHESLNRGRPLEEALACGRAAGLASLEPAVVALATSERR